MFFPERIRNITASDRVLEIGPGGTPHPRSDVLLEKIFSDPAEAEGQRGYAPELRTDREVVYYDGGSFPFDDKEFDYVICSHVLEHIEDVDGFAAEIARVGRKGYLEYPTIYYDYIYNFPEHTTFVLQRDDVLYWLPKEESGLDSFAGVNRFFYETLVKGYSSLVNDLKPYFFQGFEWQQRIETRRATDLTMVCYDLARTDIPAYQEKKRSFFPKKWQAFVDLLQKKR